LRTRRALHFAKVTLAANETHADRLRMIVRAEMQMADETDRKPSARGAARFSLTTLLVVCRQNIRLRRESIGD